MIVTYNVNENRVDIMMTSSMEKLLTSAVERLEIGLHINPQVKILGTLSLSYMSERVPKIF